MRTAFHERMDALTAQLGEMCGLAGIAMEHATQALLQADLPLAEQVITDHDRLTAMRARAEENALMLLALQAPVAGDLRVIVSSLQNVADAERMGALALHVAKITRRRHPAHTLPEDVNGYFAEMGRVAVELGNSAQEVVLSGDPRRAAEIDDEDDAMDDLHWALVHRVDGSRVETQRGRSGRRDTAGQVLRAVRRPRRRDWPPRHLPGHWSNGGSRRFLAAWPRTSTRWRARRHGVRAATHCERTAPSSAPSLARAGATPSGDVTAAQSHTARHLATGADYTETRA